MRPSLSRRRLLAGLGSAGVTAIAGCAGALGTSGRFSSTRRVSESSPDLDGAGFDAYVGRMHERYGRHGVWGTATDSSTNSLTFVGAWSGRELLLPGGSHDRPTTDEDEDEDEETVPLATVDWVLGLYRLPDGASASDTRLHRCWLWAGAIPRPVDGRVGKTSLTGLSVGVSLTDGTMGPYAPGSTVGPDRSPATIAPARPGPPGPRGTLVVRTGRVQTDPDTTGVGSGGGFGVSWAGGSAGRVSVAGVCDIERPPEARYSLRVPVSAAGGRGRF